MARAIAFEDWEIIEALQQFSKQEQAVILRWNKALEKYVKADFY